MGVLLHISDTHFGTEQAPVVEALVALAAQQRPDVVVLSGDITQRARPAHSGARRSSSQASRVQKLRIFSVFGKSRPYWRRFMPLKISS